MRFSIGQKVGRFGQLFGRFRGVIIKRLKKLRCGGEVDQDNIRKMKIGQARRLTYKLKFLKLKKYLGTDKVCYARQG